ncbi:hypothetical protein [Yunchengibacter salinarum]|uniref:hypothetical protein n=1 Tax=Yunchengibacter salinarum TaxID=3133399 RepID=UPI0035B616C1
MSENGLGADYMPLNGWQEIAKEKEVTPKPPMNRWYKYCDSILNVNGIFSIISKKPWNNIDFNVILIDKKGRKCFFDSKSLKSKINLLKKGVFLCFSLKGGFQELQTEGFEFYHSSTKENKLLLFFNQDAGHYAKVYPKISCEPDSTIDPLDLEVAMSWGGERQYDQNFLSQVGLAGRPGGAVGTFKLHQGSHAGFIVPDSENATVCEVEVGLNLPISSRQVYLHGLGVQFFPNRARQIRRIRDNLSALDKSGKGARAVLVCDQGQIRWDKGALAVGKTVSANGAVTKTSEIAIWSRCASDIFSQVVIMYHRDFLEQYIVSEDADLVWCPIDLWPDVADEFYFNPEALNHCFLQSMDATAVEIGEQLEKTGYLLSHMLPPDWRERVTREVIPVSDAIINESVRLQIEPFERRIAALEEREKELSQKILLLNYMLKERLFESF